MSSKKVIAAPAMQGPQGVTGAQGVGGVSKESYWDFYYREEFDGTQSSYNLDIPYDGELYTDFMATSVVEGTNNKLYLSFNAPAVSAYYLRAFRKNPTSDSMQEITQADPMSLDFSGSIQVDERVFTKIAGNVKNVGRVRYVCIDQQFVQTLGNSSLSGIYRWDDTAADVTFLRVNVQAGLIGYFEIFGRDPSRVRVFS